MSVENNKMQVDIENLFKQNVNDLSSIKELYRKLKELEERILQVKYIDSTLADKLKKDYEKLKKIILDENAQAKLADDIETINEKLSNDIETINEKLSIDIDPIIENLSNDIGSINLQLDTITNKTKNFINIDFFNGDDDTLKFKQAFEYCNTNKTDLELNGETYFINPDILIYSGQFSIRGVGIEKTIIKCNKTGNVLINTLKDTKIRRGRIENLTIDGNYLVSNNIELYGKKNTIRDCVIKKANALQIKLGDGTSPVWSTEITKCFIEGCDNAETGINNLPAKAIEYTSSATDNYMSDTVVTNCFDTAIIDRGSNNRFINCHVFGYPDNHRPKNCFELNGSFSSVISCQLDTPTVCGVKITGYNNNVSLNNCFWNSNFPSAGSESTVIFDNTNKRCGNNVVTSNTTTYTGTNLSKPYKFIGENIGNIILNNSGNISNDNGNQTFLHPNNYLVINRDGKWYNPLGISRDLINIKTPLSLENDWIAFDDDEVFIRKNEMGIAVLFGRISGGIEDNGTTIFTLPSQYRPSKYISMQSMYRAKDDSYKVCEIGISSSGSVVLNGVSNCKYLLLNNIQILD